MNVLNAILIVLCMTLNCINFSNGLECYQCSNQDSNKDKCLKNLVTCEQGEDVCFTEVKWGTMPYWQQGADKQYYISKGCATKTLCERTRSRNMPYCTYIWYQDWKCSHCCHGDRCNYYVILGASSVKVSTTVIAIGLVVTLLWQQFNS